MFDLNEAIEKLVDGIPDGQEVSSENPVLDLVIICVGVLVVLVLLFG